MVPFHTLGARPLAEFLSLLLQSALEASAKRLQSQVDAARTAALAELEARTGQVGVGAIGCLQISQRAPWSCFLIAAGTCCDKEACSLAGFQLRSGGLHHWTPANY